MVATIYPHKFSATVQVPGSKSHTIRRLLIAAFGNGTTLIERPLYSLDTHSCIKACTQMGARITRKKNGLLVEGIYRNNLAPLRKEAQIKKLRELKPIVVEYDGITNVDDIELVKAKIKEIKNEKICGKYKNSESGQTWTVGNYLLTHKLRQHDFKNIEHWQSVVAIPQICEKAVYCGYLPNEEIKKNPLLERFDYYFAEIEICGKSYTVKIDIAIFKDGVHLYYDHKLENKKIGQLLSYTQGFTTPRLQSNALKTKQLLISPHTINTVRVTGDALKTGQLPPTPQDLQSQGERVTSSRFIDDIRVAQICQALFDENSKIILFEPLVREVTIDVGNSGTTLFLALAFAALGKAPITFTGDAQIAARSAAPLLDALCKLGVRVDSQQGCTPITVQGPITSGRVSIACPTSQYLSALLLAIPLAKPDVVVDIYVPLLNEKPYIDMTLSYLRTLRARIEADANYERFTIYGGCTYAPINGHVPADFSSAAFPALAALCGGGEVTLLGLDPADTQGDKRFFEYVQKMGGEVEITNEYYKVWRAGVLNAITVDLNDTPDMLPALAVAACFASGDTRIVNVANARIKETDRIKCMAEELTKMGASGIEETPDGLVIHGEGGFEQRPPGIIALDGRKDHRIVMALACAALASKVPVKILGAEAAAVTYPEFLRLLYVKKRKSSRTRGQVKL